jgi:hypothetical protein
VPLAHIADDAYNKLRKDIGNDFSIGNDKITELYSFNCGNCGYKDIHDVKELECGCGLALKGNLVYRKIGDTVVYDMRGSKKRKR